MESLEQNIRRLVEQVVSGVELPEGATAAPAPEAKPAAPTGPGIFADVDSAVAAAQIAHQELVKLTLDTRREMIKNMRAAVLANAELLSKKAVEETTFGRWEDKLLKHQLVATKTPGVEDLEAIACSDDHGLMLLERAPYGLVGAIIPSTNPTTTVICNGIGMVAGGNSVIFCPHPFAKQCSNMAISLLNEAIIQADGPRNVIVGISEPSIAAANAIMKHKDVKLLVVTGGPAVVKVAMNSGKKVVAAGPGNPPVVVDETADLDKAGKAIADGGGFDCNVICICEKEVIVVASVADRLKEAIVRHGAVELNESQIEAVTKLVIADPGGPGKEGAPNKKFVGKTPRHIAKAIGVDVPEATRLLLCEVGREHPLIWTEQLMPVMPLTRVANVDDAIDLAVQCEHGFRHTAVMHSRNIDKLSKMARMMNCSIFIKNGPSYAGLGAGGAGYASMTIASPTGEGVTRARNFTRERRCTLVDHFRIV